MLRRTLIVLLCRTWCVRRRRLSAGFISPHLVYAVLGTSMPRLVCSLSSPHLLRAHVQPQRDMWAFDIVTLRYVLSCNLVRNFCHTSLWALDTVTYDMYLAAAWFELSATTVPWAWFTDVTLVFKYRLENATLLPSTRLQMKNANALLMPQTNYGYLH